MTAREITLPETNIAPENGWLEDVISSWEGLFPGAMLVSGRVFGRKSSIIICFRLLTVDSSHPL